MNVPKQIAERCTIMRMKRKKLVRHLSNASCQIFQTLRRFDFSQA